MLNDPDDDEQDFGTTEETRGIDPAKVERK